MTPIIPEEYKLFWSDFDGELPGNRRFRCSFLNTNYTLRRFFSPDEAPEVWERQRYICEPNNFLPIAETARTAIVCMSYSEGDNYGRIFVYDFDNGVGQVSTSIEKFAKRMKAGK